MIKKIFLLALPASLLLSVPVHGDKGISFIQEVRLSVELPESYEDLPLEEEIHLSLRSSEGVTEGATLRVPLKWKGSTRLEGHVELSPEGGWTVESLSSPALWIDRAPAIPPAIPSAIPAEGARETVLQARPAAVVTALFREGQAPDDLHLTISEAESLEDLLRTRSEGLAIRCEVTRPFECKIPAGRFDLKVSIPDHTPLYRWGASVRPGERLALGALSFERGSSFIGWVVGETRGVEIELTPLVGRRPAKPDAEIERRRGSLKRFVGQPDSRGFFQLKNIKPGKYRLTARGEGLSTVVREPIEIAEGGESRMPIPIEMAEPSVLEVGFTPSFAPTGEPWIVELRSPEHRAEQKRAEAGLAGFVAFRSLPRGTYQMTVLSGSGDHESRWATREVVVDRGRSEAWIEIDSVLVAGTVTYDGEPERGRLYFGGVDHVPSIVVDCDEEGRFETVLPGDGEWEVDFHQSGARATQRLEPVEITAGADGEADELAIELPATALEVRVLGPDDEPVAGAVVIGVSRSAGRKALEADTDEDGTSRVIGIAPGEIELFAISQSGDRSPKSTVVIREDQLTGPVVLSIEKTREIRAVVVDQGGRPAPGAAIQYRVEGSGPKAAQAGADGSFTMKIAEGSREAVVLVGPVDGPLMVKRVSLPDPGATIRLEIPSSRGELTIDGGGRPAKAVELYAGSVRVPNLRLLERWVNYLTGQSTKLEHSPLRIPHVEPGEYTLCPRPRSSPLECTAGHLSPEGRLDLSLREPPIEP